MERNSMFGATQKSKLEKGQVGSYIETGSKATS